MLVWLVWLVWQDRNMILYQLIYYIIINTIIYNIYYSTLPARQYYKNTLSVIMLYCYIVAHFLKVWVKRVKKHGKWNGIVHEMLKDVIA